MKKGRLSKVEKDYIQSHLKDNIEDIAAALDRSVDAVQGEVDSYSGTKTPKREKPHFINKTAVKNESGVSIMTPAASAQLDGTKEQRKPIKALKYVHSINDEESK